MRRSLQQFGLAAAVAFGLALPTQACGPFFPNSLLEDREASLYGLIEGTFDFEASRLLPASVKRPLDDVVADGNTDDVPREDVERGDLGAAWAQVEAVRAAPDRHAAEQRAAGLPAEVRFYTLAAHAFAARDLRAATVGFERVLALPAGRHEAYRLWAQYMLGRITLAQGADDGTSTASEREAANARAERAFEAVRASVQAGAADPLRLAVASLGELAMVSMRRLDYASAARLYADQAAQGSRSGRGSLLLLARQLLHDEAALQQAMTDPLLQKLVTAYLYTRRFELDEFDGYTSGIGANQSSSLLQRYLSAVDKVDPVNVAGADQFAAAAYRLGRFELAASIVSRSDSPLAAWVKAKLALRAGDRDAAARAYAEASRGFAADDRWSAAHDPSSATSNAEVTACRVNGERGVLALARGDYLEAMQLMHAAGSKFWRDQAYVAEAILSTAELKAFVDKAVPESSADAGPIDADSQTPRDNATQLRYLLARRLMRDGRWREAVVYFPTDLRANARSYADARERAEKTSQIDKARALFEAASLARHSGIELLGAELAPDNAIVDGDYELYTSPIQPPQSEFAAPLEGSRLLANRIEPDSRFHYRQVAAELANRAADSVPARSQAFAAMLCSATEWLIDREYTQARIYYQRYVAQGPYLAWAAQFGRVCPAPDFVAAAQRLDLERTREIKRFARRTAPYLAGGMLLFGIAILVWRRRRDAVRASRA